MPMQDQASSSVNDTGTDGKIDTPLTHPGSGFELAAIRRDLIAKRVKYGADSPVGHRCSNLILQIENYRHAMDTEREILDRSIMRTMAELARLTSQ